MELQDHGITDQKLVNQQLVRMSQETGIGLVCTNDVHYTYADDVEAHDVLLCIQTGKKITDEDRMRYEGGQFYVKSEDEMRALFPYDRPLTECDIFDRFKDLDRLRMDQHRILRIPVRIDQRTRLRQLLARQTLDL